MAHPDVCQSRFGKYRNRTCESTSCWLPSFAHHAPTTQCWSLGVPAPKRAATSPRNSDHEPPLQACSCACPGISQNHLLPELLEGFLPSLCDWHQPSAFAAVHTLLSSSGAVEATLLKFQFRNSGFMCYRLLASSIMFTA